jgi:phosphatidate phosphatase APP1
MALLGFIRRAVKLERHHTESALFKGRVRPFLVSSRSDVEVQISVRGSDAVTAVSGQDGHFRTTIEWPRDEGQPGDWVTIEVNDGDAQATGEVQLLDDTGLSVVSDIDDTIKVTEVGDRATMLSRTFLQEFAAVDGMARPYAEWSGNGAAFHYVSASPWQLYDPLSELFERAGFPAGSFHLRKFRFRDSSVWSVLQTPEQFKLETITPVIQAFPKRRFVLIGDAGETDPKAYGQLAKDYPTQVAAIFIRALTADAEEAQRVAEALNAVPRDRWVLFDNPHDIADRAVVLFDNR